MKKPRFAMNASRGFLKQTRFKNLVNPLIHQLNISYYFVVISRNPFSEISNFFFIGLDGQH